MNGASEASLVEQLLACGVIAIGEVAISRENGATFTLTHRDDRERRDLQVFASGTDVARYDDAGNYRPLKTAPSLRHGWQLRAANGAQIARLIDEIYPGRLAALAAFQQSALSTTPFRATLGRQTGMYRIAARISDAQADELIGNFCRSDGGCLRTIFWRRDSAGTVPSTRLPPEKFDAAYDQTGRGERAVALLCQEACNLLVAAARAVAKGEK